MENDKNTNSEQKPVSPNELMFAKQDKEKTEKRPSGKRRGVIIAVAAFTAVAIILCAQIFSGVLGRFIESFMIAPAEQLSLVLTREAKAFIEGESDFDGFSLDLPLSYRGSIETRVDEQFLELINKLKLVDADLRELRILNDIDLYYRA